MPMVTKGVDAAWKTLLPVINNFFESEENVTNYTLWKFKQNVANYCLLTNIEDVNNTQRKILLARTSKQIGIGFDNDSNSEKRRNRYQTLFIKYVTLYCNNFLDKTSNLTSTELSKVFITKWTNYKLGSKILSSLIEDIDGSWSKSISEDLWYKGCGDSKMFSLYEEAVDKWKTTVFRKQKVLLEEVAFKLIDDDRNGELIDSILLSNLVNFYVYIGVYKNYFHRKYLSFCYNYYNLESAKKFEELSVSEYLVHTEFRLQDEMERVAKFLHFITKEPVVKILEERFIQSRLEAFKSEFPKFLLQDQNDDLKRMYSLIARKPVDFPEFWKMFREHVKSQGLIAIQMCDNDLKNVKVVIPAVLKLYKKFDGVVEYAFCGDPRFRVMFKNGFADFLNQNSITEEFGGSRQMSLLLAKYLDLAMRKNACADGSDSEETLKDVMSIYTYLSDKDVFQEFSIKLMSKRLLKQQLVDDLEVIFLTEIRPHFNSDYTARIENMIQDIRLSKNLTESYYENSSEVLKMNFSCKVLQPSIWPFKQSRPHNLTWELENCVSGFTAFYSSRHSTKKLQWTHHLSSGEIVSNCFKHRYQFALSTWQMTVLMLFNTSIIWTFGQILEHTQLEREVLVQIVEIFLKSKLLTCKTSATLQPDSEICLNLSYNNKKHNINLNVPLKAEVKEDEAQVKKNVEVKRKILCECAIVRVMKARKKITYNDLVKEVIPEISKHHHKIAANDIKKAIKILIEKSYIKINEEDSKYYDYIS